MFLPQKLLLWAAALVVFFDVVQCFPRGLIRRAGVKPTLVGGASQLPGGGTYPRAARLSDSSLIISLTTFPSGNNAITVLRSTNNGASWQALGEATRKPSNAHDVDNSFPLQLPSGRVLIAFRDHDKNPSTGAYTVFRITVVCSDNGGASWEYLSTPSMDQGPVNGNWEPYLYQPPSGPLQLYYSRENSGADQDILRRTSSDGGMTWSGATTISSGSNTRNGMWGLAPASSGTLVGVFEQEQNGLFTVQALTSSNNGNSWGGQHLVYSPTCCNNNAGSPQIANVGGTLVVTFMTDEDTMQHQWINGASTKLVTSGNGGGSWGNKITVGQAQSNWPGVFAADANNALVMYDNGGAKVQKVGLS